MAGCTPVFFAARDGHVDCVRALAELGADLDKPDHQHNITPVAAAAFRGHVDCVGALAELGASLANFCWGFNPIYVAAHEGHVEVIKALAELGADLACLNESGFAGCHPVCIAAEKEHVEVIRALVELGADPEVCTGCYNSPLTDFSHNLCEDTPAVLLYIGIDVRRFFNMLLCGNNESGAALSRFHAIIDQVCSSSVHPTAAGKALTNDGDTRIGSGEIEIEKCCIFFLTKLLGSVLSNSNGSDRAADAMVLSSSCSDVSLFSEQRIAACLRRHATSGAGVVRMLCAQEKTGAGGVPRVPGEPAGGRRSAVGGGPGWPLCGSGVLLPGRGHAAGGAGAAHDVQV
jgi:ankyrin repeat protein